MHPDDAVIVSIPYSGTRYLRSALNIPKSVHTYVPPDVMMEYIGDARYIFAPLRQPESNWAAWARRWPHGKPWDRRIAEFERAWMGMAWICNEYDVQFIPLDHDVGPRLLTGAQELVGLVPFEPEKRFGEDDEGSNSYDYNVKHLYRYNFVKQYYTYKENHNV